MDNDFIKRVAAKSVMAIATIDGYNSRIINTALDSIPAEDVRPVVHAQWDDKTVAFYRRCPTCGCCIKAPNAYESVFLDGEGEYNFCLNCGAIMDGESPE